LRRRVASPPHFNNPVRREFENLRPRFEVQSPDIHHLRAAEGWLELGNAREAQAELDCISEAAQGSVEVLAVRWGILARFKLWEQCVAVATRIIELAPTEVFGWIHRSYALHELKRTSEARDLLLPAAKLFPKVETVTYNLACYECQLGDLAAARDWFRLAMKRHDRAELKARALEDEDLKPLWPEIEQMPVPAKQSGPQ
jgi:Flp pilus assembly protein TadD